MRFLFVCAVFFGCGRCVAQVPVPPDQCLGGNLIGIQPDSVTSKFNDKISTYRFAPGAEIWSRGTDVESPMQLTIGDQVYIRCTRTEANGPVLITVLAAVEQNDAISLEPHHIKAISVCIGKLETRTPDTLSLKSDALCRWGFPAAQSSCDRWRPARPFDGVTSRWMKLIRRSDSGERWKQFSALSEIHPKSELDRPWIPLPGDSPEVRIRKIADRAVQVAVVEGIVKVGADCD